MVYLVILVYQMVSGKTRVDDQKWPACGVSSLSSHIQCLNGAEGPISLQNLDGNTWRRQCQADQQQMTCRGATSGAIKRWRVGESESNLWSKVTSPWGHQWLKFSWPWGLKLRYQYPRWVPKASRFVGNLARSHESTSVADARFMPLN